MLNHKWAAVTCLLLAIVNKCIIAFFFSSLNGDKGLYLLFADSLLKTGTLAEPVSLLENGKTVFVLDPAIHSPLYSLVAVPFLWLTHSFFQTQAIVSVLGWILFYTGLYKLASLIFREKWVVSLFLLCTAFFLYPHELASTPKDTLAVAFTFWSIVLMQQFLHQPKFQTTVALAITLSCLALVKLLYVPFAAVFLFLLLAFLLLEKKRYFLHAGLLIASLALIGLLVYQFVFLPSYELGAKNYVGLPDDGTFVRSGLFLSNLWYTFPFISSSLIDTHLWAVQVEKLSGFSFSQVMRFFLLADAVLFVFLFVTSLFFSRQIIANRVMFILLVASVTMVGAVVMLSLTSQTDSNRSIYGVWTFVMDARSFLVPMITLQLA
ncbi:MAG: hypothetical protein EON98_03530, partial [Chitinophagaceae bacterium]